MSEKGKTISEWREDAPRKTVLRDEEKGKFRNGVKTILQHAVHREGWGQYEQDICDRAELDVESAKEYILELAKAEAISKNTADRLLYLLHVCSTERY